MREMTLGGKIKLSFGLVLAITLLLGAAAIHYMKNSEHVARDLAEVQVPKGNIALQILAEINALRLHMQGYVLSGDITELKLAKEQFVELQISLDEAQKLGEAHKLHDFLKERAITSEATKRLALATEKLEILTKSRASADKSMAENARIFTDSINAYAKTQLDSLHHESNNNLAKEKLHSRIEKLDEIMQIGNRVYTARLYGQRAQVMRDPEVFSVAISQFEPVYSILDTLKRETHTAQNRQQLDTISNAAKAYEQILREFILIINELNEERAVIVKLGEEVSRLATGIAKEALDATTQDSMSAADSLTAASAFMIFGVILAVVLGFALSLYTIRSITRPIIEAVRVISEANSQVVSASGQISDSSNSLAEGSSEQASAVEEVSATIEESTAINNQNSENGREADILARIATESAKQGNAKVQQLMGAMDKITDSSQKIAKIIKTIDEIAFQTNLLALNAAVEAARAGEHGLGFAVVADEVKNLAQRSAEAAKETAAIIEGAIEEVKNGNQIAKETNDSFVDIFEKAKKTSDLIGEISISIKEQAEGMNQIGSAMAQVDTVTQQNAAHSEQAAAAAEELNAQAIAMMQSTQAIAKLVGLRLDSLAVASAKPATRNPHAPMPYRNPARRTRHRMPHAPESMPQRQSKISPEDEVFPLEADDLKEF